MLFPGPPSFKRRIFLRSLRWAIVFRTWFWFRSEKGSEQPSWYETNLFLALASAFLAVTLVIGVAMRMDMRWLLLLGWILGSLVVWIIARSTCKVRGWRLLLTGPLSLSLAGALLSVESRTRPSVHYSIALITTIERMHDENGRYMKGGSNDLVGVLRIQQRWGRRVRHVRALRITGDVRADFNSYLAFLSKGNGGESINEIEASYLKRKPFFHLLWVLYPSTPVGVDQDDREFVKFTISQSKGAIGFSGNPKDYFGFESTNQHPRYPMTSPTWSLLIRFLGTNREDLTGIYPTPGDEVRSGKVKFEVDLDGEMTGIPAQEIKCPWPVSLDQETARTMLSQDLFYAIDNGDRIYPPFVKSPWGEP
jgi:hypothetical protein